MPDVKNDTSYYVKLPNHYLYVRSVNSLHLDFASFFEDASSFTRDEAITLAKRYSLEVKERTITTTTEINEKIIYKGDSKS